MSARLMHRLRLALMTLLAVLAIGSASAVAQTEEVDIEVFYRELEPHGRWLDHPRYGEVWQPNVDRGWRPYTRGQWVNTDEHGWYWESDEPFGWAVYHYGRWYLDEQEGWVWVPGTEWAPAWVAWRHSDEEVGWAPLPPEAEWRDGEIVHATSFYDSPRFSPAWCFVPVALLTAPRIYSHVVSPRRNSYYLGRTRFVPWHRTATPHFYNSGVERRRWERITGRRVEVRRIVSVDRPFRDGPRRYRPGEVQVYRPRVVGLPRDDGRPGFRPPVSRRDPAERRTIERPIEPRLREGRPSDPPVIDRRGRPDFDPPVSRRDPGERRTIERPIEPRVREGRPSDPPVIDRRGRPDIDPPVSRRDPGERRTIDRPIEPRLREGRPSDPPVVDRGGRPAFDPPVSRRDPAERRAIERPIEPRVRDGRPPEAPVVDRGGPPVSRRDPGERRFEPPREQPRIAPQPSPPRAGGGPPPQGRPAEIPNTN